MRLLPGLILLAMLWAGPAFANAQMAADHCRAPDVGNGGLFYYNMACANSWPGSGQVIRNIIKFDDSADTTDPQSSANIVLGGSTAINEQDPTSVGHAGHEGTHLTFEGNANFLKYAAQTGGDFSVVDGKMGTWHQTGRGNYTLLMPICYEASGAVQTLWSTKALGANVGLSFFIGTSGLLNLTLRGDTAATVASTVALTDGACTVVGFSHSESANQSKIWYNGTGETKAHSITGGSTAVSMAATMGVTFSTGFADSLYFESTSKWYGAWADTVYYSSAQTDSIISEFETTTGVDLTP